MAIDTFRVYVYQCDHPDCSKEFTVEDRGGKTGSTPMGIFTGMVSINDEKGVRRVNWVACSFEHIIGATISTVKKSLGN